MGDDALGGFNNTGSPFMVVEVSSYKLGTVALLCFGDYAGWESGVGWKGRLGITRV